MDQQEKEFLVEAILSAFDDYHEATVELDQHRAEYTGYSPSYALGSWIELQNKSKRRVVEALDAYVDAKIKEARS